MIPSCMVAMAKTWPPKFSHVVKSTHTCQPSAKRSIGGSTRRRVSWQSSTHCLDNFIVCETADTWQHHLALWTCPTWWSVDAWRQLTARANSIQDSLCRLQTVTRCVGDRVYGGRTFSSRVACALSHQFSCRPFAKWPREGLVWRARCANDGYSHLIARFRITRRYNKFIGYVEYPKPSHSNKLYNGGIKPTLLAINCYLIYRCLKQAMKKHKTLYRKKYFENKQD